MKDAISEDLILVRAETAENVFSLKPIENDCQIDFMI